MGLQVVQNTYLCHQWTNFRRSKFYEIVSICCCAAFAHLACIGLPIVDPYGIVYRLECVCQKLVDDFFFHLKFYGIVSTCGWRNWYLVWGHGCDTTDSQMSPQPRRSRGCGDIWESVVSQPWPKTRYQFLFHHGTTKLTLNSSQTASQLSKFKGQSHCKHWVTWPDCFATPINT